MPQLYVTVSSPAGGRARSALFFFLGAQRLQAKLKRCQPQLAARLAPQLAPQEISGDRTPRAGTGACRNRARKQKASILLRPSFPRVRQQCLLASKNSNSNYCSNITGVSCETGTLRKEATAAESGELAVKARACRRRHGQQRHLPAPCGSARPCNRGHGPGCVTCVTFCCCIFRQGF